jgi:hypothetical protein
MKSVSGTIIINTEKEPAIQINARTNRIDTDILRPELFKLFEAIEDDDKADEKREGRMDKLKDKLNTAKKAIKELKNSEKDLLDILDIPKEFTQRVKIRSGRAATTRNPTIAGYVYGITLSIIA